MAVLIIGFQRANEISKVISCVSKFKPNKIYLAMDGPKDNNNNQKKRCHEARKVALEKINWDCEIKTKFGKKNLGLRKFIFSSIDWFFTQETEGLILEDDILIHPQFIDFAKELIFRKDVACISACTFESKLKIINNPNGSFMSPIPSIWGWYSTSQIWKDFRTKKRKKISPITNFFRLSRSISIWQSFVFSMIIEYMDKGKMESWAYEFLFYCINNNKYAIFPNICMAENIGNTELAENCHSKKALSPKLSKLKINVN